MVCNELHSDHFFSILVPLEGWVVAVPKGVDMFLPFSRVTTTG